MADNYMNRGFVTDAQAMARGQRVPNRRVVPDAMSKMGVQIDPKVGSVRTLPNGVGEYFDGSQWTPSPLPAVGPAPAVAARALPVGVKPPGLMNPFQLGSPSQMAAAGRVVNAGPQYKRWGR